MKAHTPGPWMYAKQKEQTGWRWIVDSPSGGIAVIHGKDAESEANARLIAAAPDLLIQLKAIVVQIEASGRLIVPPGVARAIADAEGRNPR